MKPNLFSALFVSKLGTNEPFWVEVKMMKSTKSALLAASALALMLTAANAQEYGPGSYDDGYNAPPPPSEYGPGPYGNDDYGPPPPADYGEGYGAPENAPENMPENVIVIAPPYQTDHSSLAPTEITKLSMNVAYDDLDLRSASGAHELRARVRDAAHDVCDRLAGRFPHALYDTTSCYKQALHGGLNRADTAIHEARNYAYYDDRE
jgi:UrcA family protein